MILSRLLTSVAIAAILNVPAEAQRFQPWGGPTSNPPPANCPFPVDGGCAASPGGTFQVANFAAHAQQSGQTWTCNAACLAAGGTASHPFPSNQCGVDYTCGHYTATASLIDPATTAGLNALSAQGCTLTSNGSTSGGPFIDCTQATVSLKHFSFFSVSLNKCIPMAVHYGTNTLILEDDNWNTDGTNTDNCHTENFVGNGSMFVWIVNPGVSTVIVKSITQDGGGVNSGGGGLAQCMAFDTTAITSLTITYSVSKNCDNQPFIANNSPDRTELYNYFENMVFLCTTGCLHAEDVEQSTVSVDRAANFDIEYNTFLQGSAVAPCGTTALYAPLDLRGASNGSVTLKGNVGIINIAATAQSCQGGANSKLVSNAWAYFGGNYSGQIRITSNWRDNPIPVGDPQLPITPFKMNGVGTCTFPATFSNNTDLETGNGDNAWDSNNQPSC